MTESKCICGESERVQIVPATSAHLEKWSMKAVCRNCGREGPRSGTREEALEAFFRMRDVSEHKITLSVAISGCDMPAFGGYLDGSVHEPVEEGMFPRGKILLNLDAIMFSCVDSAELDPAEIAADCITHELVHAIQDYFCEATTEYGLEEAILAARGYEVPEAPEGSKEEPLALVPVRLLKELKGYALNQSFYLSESGNDDGRAITDIDECVSEVDEIIYSVENTGIYASEVEE